jgi:hypothetical protein
VTDDELSAILLLLLMLLLLLWLAGNWSADPFDNEDERQ